MGDAGYTSDEYKRESQQFGFIRTRYRGLTKNAIQVNADEFGQLVPAAQATAGYLRRTPPQNAPMVDNEAEKMEIWRQNAAKK